MTKTQELLSFLGRAIAFDSPGLKIEIDNGDFNPLLSELQGLISERHQLQQMVTDYEKIISELREENISIQTANLTETVRKFALGVEDERTVIHYKVKTCKRCKKTKIKILK